MTKWVKVKDGEWFPLNTNGHRFACCDCGLVHVADFRVKGGYLQARMVRNERSTALVRRHKRARP